MYISKKLGETSSIIPKSWETGVAVSDSWVNCDFGGALDSLDTNLSCILVEGDLEYSLTVMECLLI